MTETPRHSVSVAAAIFDESGQKVLLIKRRDNGRWEPPGGILELDETIEDGLRREVHEETGVAIEVGPLTGVYKNMTAGIVALVFRCTATTEPAKQSDEATAIQWLSIEQMERELSAAYAIRILDAVRSSQGARVRQHDGTNLIETAQAQDRP